MPVVAYNHICGHAWPLQASSFSDAIVIISYTGRTLRLIETARVAARSWSDVYRNAQTLVRANWALLYCIAELKKTEDTDIYTPDELMYCLFDLLDAWQQGVLPKAWALIPNAHL